MPRATAGDVESPTDRKTNPPDAAMPLVTFDVSAEDFDDAQDLQFTVERPGASNSCGDAELVPLTSALPDTDPDRRDYWLVRTMVHATAGKRGDLTGTTRTATVQLRPRPNDQGKYCVRIRVSDQGTPVPVELAYTPYQVYIVGERRQVRLLLPGLTPPRDGHVIR